MAYKELSHEEKVTRLGEIGEKIVTRYYSCVLGKVVEPSLDPYDREKDLLVEGKKHEVKTQVPFVTQGAFAVKDTQLKKLRGAHTINFISVPHWKLEYHKPGWIWELQGFAMMEMKGLIGRKLVPDRHTGEKRMMVLIPMNLCTPIYELNEEDVKLLVKYSVSE